ncbi:MAG: polyprenyl synthetase family protein, partial [Myxococcota bacterium]
MFDSLPIDEVETLMVELAHGSTSEKTGAIVSEHLATGGKRLRARLVLAASREFGVPFELAIPWAAACELLHNATLVHDDVQDGDETRRGQPTTWVRHGTASAINAGDLLLVLPTLAIERVNSDLSVRWHLARQLAYQATRVIRGQVAEYEMTHHGPIDLNTYYNAIDGKTSPLFELPVIGAALLAGRAPETAESLGAPFRSLGRLFQMQDDVLDLYGEKGRDQPGADIREGKISAIVVTHLTQYPEEKTDVLEIL